MKKLFITGLATLLPIAVTVWVIVFLMNFLTKPFLGLTTDLVRSWAPFASENMIKPLSELLILCFLFFLILFLGLIARRFFFDTLLKLGDHILDRIPIVSLVYKTAKEIIQSLFGSSKQPFKQVILTPFPYPGSYCLGLTSPKTSDMQEGKLTTVFIPTGPNPMTGFLILVPQKTLIYLNMKPEDAIKYVVSCAVIKPPAPL